MTADRETPPERNAPFEKSAAQETNPGVELPGAQLPSVELPDVQLPNVQLDVGEWELCFAWHPVRLYGTGRFAWLRTISRRPVFIGSFRLKTDYSDTPSEVPAA
jgi:hypothetical protein